MSKKAISARARANWKKVSARARASSRARANWRRASAAVLPSAPPPPGLILG